MELSQAHLRYLLAIGELSQGKAAVSSTQVARVLQVLSLIHISEPTRPY